ncbi:response regulator transcription factor [Segatella buccae]
MTKNRKISVLLAEDEQTLAMIIKDTLDAQDFNITPAADGEEALRLFLARKPDVLVADVMMPHMDGFELVRRIRRVDSHTPVLFLTARSSVEDVVKGFELGANDYLKKPFGMQELIVRLRALMGRAARYRPEDRPVVPAPTIGISRYRLDAVRQQLLFAGQTVPLSHRETELLRMLAERRNDVVETQDILLKLWGDDSFFNARSLQVFITKLRHKLAKDDSIRIVNVRGIGYKLLF